HGIRALDKFPVGQMSEGVSENSHRSYSLLLILRGSPPGGRFLLNEQRFRLERLIARIIDQMSPMCSLAHRNSRENRTRFHKCGIKTVGGSAGERKRQMKPSQFASERGGVAAQSQRQIAKSEC